MTSYQVVTRNGIDRNHYHRDCKRVVLARILLLSVCQTGIFSSCSGLRQKLAIQRVEDWDRGDAKKRLKRVVKPDLVLTREADPRAYNTTTP